MVKLTDCQLIVLSAAAAREDGLAVAPVKMNKAAAKKVGSSLVTSKLLREGENEAGDAGLASRRGRPPDKPDDHQGGTQRYRG